MRQPTYSSPASQDLIFHINDIELICQFKVRLIHRGNDIFLTVCAINLLSNV